MLLFESLQRRFVKFFMPCQDPDLLDHLRLGLVFIAYPEDRLFLVSVV